MNRATAGEASTLDSVPMPELATIGTPLFWTVFLVGVVAILILDLGVLNRKAHVVRPREALLWVGLCVSLALIFAAWLFWRFGTRVGLEFVTGYLIEYALSVDNLFVFLVVFSYFSVPPQFQHRVLFWGIVGALVFRAIFIALGAVVLSAFVWTMVVFGLFLIATGIKMLATHGNSIDPGNNPLVRVFRRIMPTTDDYHGQRFFVRQNGALLATPLFVALLVVEFTDVLFAVDSVPAIFSITQNPFIVFTSNVFAILGLRALFFAVAGLMQLFRFLHFGLAAILMFVGVKMLYGYAQKVLVPDWPHFPIGLSLAIIVGVLASSILASVLLPVGPGNDDAPGTSSRPQQPKERELGR